MRLPQASTKTGRVLAGLMSGETYNLFEAEIQLSDHSLHSTISRLQNEYGIQISRHRETVAGYESKPTSCCRYWIDFDERMRINREINSEKEKALIVSDETNEKSFDMFICDDNPSEKLEKTSLLALTLKYAKDGIKSFTRF